MNQREIQKVFDFALETWKERQFPAYASEHQLVLCIILGFIRVHKQTTGQDIDFKVLELPDLRSIDDE